MSFLIDFTSDQLINSFKRDKNKVSNIKLLLKDENAYSINKKIDEFLNKILSIVYTTSYIIITLFRILSLEVIAYMIILLLTLGLAILTISPLIIYTYLIYKIILFLL